MPGNMKVESNEVVIVRDKNGSIFCTTDTGGNDAPVEFPSVQKVTEYLQKTFNRPNLYDDYDYTNCALHVKPRY
jgi:hypothetical protein